MIKIGVTGGIGSGKTLVCKIFEHLGVPVYNSDEQAKQLINQNEQLKHQIITLLGPESYENNQYNSSWVASQVYNNQHLLEKLNQIIHPAVQSSFNSWVEKQTSECVIQEAAILFESGAATFLDVKITVSAPKELRIKRVMQRNKISRNQVLNIMDKQLPEQELIKNSDYVILNDEEHSLIEQVVGIHQKLCFL